MDCIGIERRLSEYLESSLSADEMLLVEKHLDGCPNCSALFAEMRSVVSACRNYPTFEMDPDFLEKILLRTSGRPRTRSLRERLGQFVVRPMLRPRFAAGFSLAAMFLALSVYLMMPRMPAVMSALSPSGLIQMMDSGVQRLYSTGIKAYYKKNDLQAQYSYFKNSTLNKLRFMMEKIEVPVEGRKKSVEPVRGKEKSTGEKTNSIRPLSAEFG
jgi:hypothetical protein